MKRKIHPDFIRLYQEIRAEEELLGEERFKAWTPNEDRFFGMIADESPFSTRTILMGALLLVISVFFGIEFGKSIGASKREEATTDRHTSVTEAQTMKRDVTSEIDLLKHVLSSLYETVKALSKEKEALRESSTLKEKEMLPSPIRVVTENSVLRELPSTDSKSKTTLKKGVELLALEKRGEWLQVLSPFGDEAWIHEDLVQFKDEKL